RVTDRKLGNRVTFVGEVADVEPYLRAADLFVLPSYHEGLSLSLLEAAALGLPCIAGAIPQNEGILPDDLLPLVPVRRPDLLALAMERELTASSLEAAHRRRSLIVDRFGIAAVASRHLELFERLLDQRRPIKPV
ncbi:MAG: glycosyltransferase, partial [Planctomycetia bacterium]